MTAMKLNLGCGDKILPGYVNVDVVETRAGKRPDVLCDLHALDPFKSDTAEEILAVHVVEHFWRWGDTRIIPELRRNLLLGTAYVFGSGTPRTSAQRSPITSGEKRSST
jgi:predicted SAM-dependent methyltransferase